MVETRRQTKYRARKEKQDRMEDSGHVKLEWK